MRALRARHVLHPGPRRRVGALLAFALLTACGTTVPITSTTTSQGGLGGELAPGGEVLTPGAVAPGGPSTGTAEPGYQSGTTTGAVPAGTTGTTGSGPTPDVGSGVANRKPIVIGFLAADFAKLVATVGGSTTSDPHATTRALVRALNAQGGLAGRQIKPLFFTVDGTAADYSSQEQAACAMFTEDNHAEVVIGGGVGGQGFYACLLKKNVPFVTGNPTEGVDTVELAKYPNVFNIPGMAVDRQATAFFDQSERTGWLSKKNKLGVLHSGCDWGLRTYNNVVLPRARRLGVAVERFDMGCTPKGAAEVPATSNAVQSASLQFRGAGVDRIMIVNGGGDAQAYLLFANNADSQRWYPGYIVGTNAVAQAWAAAGVVSQEQAANTRGAGWVPVIDTTAPPQTAQMKACRALIKAGGGPDEEVPGQFGLMCDPFWALQAALRANGGFGGFQALRPAFEGLGSSYVSGGTIGGATLLGPSKHDGARLVAPFAYVSGCSCFRYQATPQPLT